MRKYLRKNRKIRTAASLAVTVVMSVAIFLLFLSIELLMGYLSDHLFRDSLQNSGYAAEMEKDMLEKQKQLFAAYGLPESLTEKIWGENKAYLAFSQYVDTGAFKEDGVDFGQQEILESYLKEQEVHETEGTQGVLKNVVDESKAICRRYVYPSFVNGYRQLVQGRKPIFMGMAAVSAMIAALGAVFLLGCYHYKHHALYYITGSCFTAFVWNLAATVLLSIGGGVATPGVGPAYFSEFLEIFKYKGCSPWYIVSIVAAAATVLLLLASIRMKNKSRTGK
ncbi:hypothetical protein D3Z47_09280 [Lachnospiraceae bacterium]|jgi:hypothetical protein|nr:hypothetical protein [Lachnospiraceae bacterium]